MTDAFAALFSNAPATEAEIAANEAAKARDAAASARRLADAGYTAGQQVSYDGDTWTLVLIDINRLAMLHRDDHGFESNVALSAIRAAA